MDDGYCPDCGRFMDECICSDMKASTTRTAQDVLRTILFEGAHAQNLMILKSQEQEAQKALYEDLKEAMRHAAYSLLELADENGDRESVDGLPISEIEKVLAQYFGQEENNG